MYISSKHKQSTVSTENTPIMISFDSYKVTRCHHKLRIVEGLMEDIIVLMSSLVNKCHYYYYNNNNNSITIIIVSNRLRMRRVSIKRLHRTDAAGVKMCW